MKNLINEIHEMIQSVDYEYEMGCLISSEFTPAPSYDSIFDLIDDSEFEVDEVIAYLKKASYEEFEEMKKNDEWYEVDCDGNGIKIAELDHSYTPSGQLAQFLMYEKERK